MNKLFRGVAIFWREDFQAYKELLKNLGRRQRPHTLFVGCSDSRVVRVDCTHPAGRDFQFNDSTQAFELVSSQP